MPSKAPQHSIKSTTVRLFSSLVVVLVAALSRFAPMLFARWAMDQFLTTRRRPRPERETAWLEGGERFEVISRGGRLAAWSWGEGPTVLLIHGWDGRGAQLGALVAPLVDSGYRVVAYDGPGHGQSDGRSASLPELTWALQDVVAALGGVHAVVAHSLGAAAVTAALSAGVDVDRLVYFSPPADPEGAFRRAFAAFGLPTELFDGMKSVIEERFEIRLADYFSLALAPAMSVPLLVLHDHDDRTVPFDEGRALADAWPEARLIPTHSLGHYQILRDAERVGQAVEFLTRQDVQSRIAA